MYQTAAIPIATVIKLTVRRIRTDGSAPLCLPRLGRRLDNNSVLFRSHGEHP